MAPAVDAVTGAAAPGAQPASDTSVAVAGPPASGPGHATSPLPPAALVPNAIAATPRQLLAAQSQLAYHRLLQALQDWWLWREARQAAAHKAATRLPGLLAACTGLLLLAGTLAALLWRQQRRLRRMLAGPVDDGLAGMPRHQLLSQALLWRLGQTGQSPAAGAAASEGNAGSDAAPAPRHGRPKPDDRYRSD